MPVAGLSLLVRNGDDQDFNKQTLKNDSVGELLEGATSDPFLQDWKSFGKLDNPRHGQQYSRLKSSSETLSRAS